MPLKLEKRAGGLWYAVGTVQTQFGAKKLSERVRRSTGSRDRKVGERIAAQIEAEAIADLERKYRAERGIDDTTFEQAALAYMEAGHSRRFLAPLIIHFRGKRVADIEAIDIEEAGRAIYPNAAPSTRRRQCWTPAHAVLNHHHGKRPRAREDNARTVWLTPEKAEPLFEEAGRISPQLRVMTLLLAGCGLRTGELLVLDVDDVYLDTRQLRIRAEEAGASKTGRARWVTIPERAVAELRALIETRGEGRLFLTPKGAPYVIRDHGGGQIAAAFGKARRAADLGNEVTPHVLRHTFATWFYAQTTDTLRLEQEGGWTDPKMVRRYTKLAPADLGARLLMFGWDFRPQQRTPLRVVKEG